MTKISLLAFAAAAIISADGASAQRALAARQEQALELKPEPKALPNGRH
jgi:hypothetical protein